MRLLPLHKPVHPVGEQVIEEEYDARNAPGDGISPVDVLYLVNEVHHYLYVRYAENAPHGEHDSHRHDGLSRAAADGGDGVRKRQQAVEEGLYPRLTDSVGDNGGIRRERPYELGREYPYHEAYRLRKQYGGYYAEAGALFRAVILARAEVLADKRGERQ